MHHCTTPPRYTLKSSVYALRHVETGHYIRTDGEQPRLKPLAQACLAPATPAGLRWIIQRAADKLQPIGVPFEIDRIEASRLAG